jgi:hypothetical protein
VEELPVILVRARVRVSSSASVEVEVPGDRTDAGQQERYINEALWCGDLRLPELTVDQAEVVEIEWSVRDGEEDTGVIVERPAARSETTRPALPVVRPYPRGGRLARGRVRRL